MDIKTWIWLIMILGSWAISGAVAFTTVRLSIKILTKETDENRKKILIVEQNINKRLQDSEGTSIYMTVKKCQEHNIERDRRRDDVLRNTCEKIKEVKQAISKLSDNQLDLNKSVSNLIGRVEQYIKSAEAK